MTEPTTGAALAGIRVLDLSRILAGPWCTQVLADLGADVVKIERPGHGDDTRTWGPPFLEATRAGASDESAYFLAANRNKRSMAIDISRTDGQAIVRALARDADVLVENFKVGDMRRYGLDYETLSADNPRLVYCSITGFGQTGPYAERPGYDFVIQAMGGLMSITGDSDEHGGGAQKCGVPIADLMTGMYACTAILAALQERARSGRGQAIDMSLLDTQLAWLANQASNYLVSGRAPRRWGNAHPNLAPYQSFRATDGEFIVAVGNDRQYAALCHAIGLPALADDARFLTNALRLRHRDALVTALAVCFVAAPRQRWLDALEAAGVPCGPIRSIPEALADPHVAARGMTVDLPHANGAPLTLMGNPIRLSRTPVHYRRAPPALASDTATLLRELGWSDERIAQAAADGLIQVPHENH